MVTSTGRFSWTPVVVQVVTIDSSDEGSGFLYRDDWGYVNWAIDCPQLINSHINVKETVSVVFAARRWAPLLRNKKVLFLTDNTTARANNSKGVSVTSEVMPWLQELYFLSTVYNFDIVSIHIPGQDMPADDVSRLSTYGNIRSFMNKCGVCDYITCWCFMCALPSHMSIDSAFYLYKQATNRVRWSRNWTK